MHAKVDKVARCGAKTIAKMAAGCARMLKAKGARAVLEAIAADRTISAEAQSAARDALGKLS